MTQTKSFSVFSNLKSKTHLKIKGKRKQARKSSFTQLAKHCCVGGSQDCCHNHSHPLIFQLSCIFQTNNKSRNINYIFQYQNFTYTTQVIVLSKLGRSIVHAFGPNLKDTFQKLHTSEKDMPTLKTSQILCLWFTYMRSNFSFYVFLHLEFMQLDRLHLLQCSIKQCTAIQNGQQLKNVTSALQSSL